MGKRDADDMDPGDGGMSAWLDELCRIPREARDNIMMLDILNTADIGDDVMEIFSPPRVVTIAKRHGLKAEWSVDRLTERSPGVAWDLLKKSHQAEVIRIVEETKPGLLIGSPPCTWFSRMMQINWAKIPAKRRREMMN